MNETSLQTLCNSSILYHTLEEQNDILHTKEGLPPRRTVSTTRSTYIHFGVQLEEHLAAVQLIIAPFTIRSIPGQTFYTSNYRYTLCCNSENPSTICQIVQRTYDIYYHPIQ